MPIDLTTHESEFLHDSHLFERITIDELGKKIEGELKARQAIFNFACISLVRNKDGTNNLLVNAESRTGKDFVTKRVTQIFPPNIVESLNSASPRTFTYWHANEKVEINGIEQEFSWDGKICRITDMPNALLKSESFKTFLSDEEKSVIVNKNKQGANAACEYSVKGKPIFIGTTASANPKKEMLNRFCIINLDESNDQTQAIIRRKLEEASGKRPFNRSYSITSTAALSKLKKVFVEIPFADDLLPHLPDDELRMRSDTDLILNLIKANAALYQYQREKKDGKVLATPQDYEIARQSLKQIHTGRQANLTRGRQRVLETATSWCEANPDKRFSVQDIRQYKPFISERKYYWHLDWLAENGYLSLKHEIRGQNEQGKGGREVAVYRVFRHNYDGLELPPFTELGVQSVQSNQSNHSGQSVQKGGKTGLSEHFE